MSSIRTQQTEKLITTGQENITFRSFDKDGNVLSSPTLNKNVLKQIKTNLKPLNENFEVEYLPKLKTIINNIKTQDIQLINRNPNFRYSTFNWDINSTNSRISIPSEETIGVIPVSGIYCLEQKTIVTSGEEKKNYLIRNKIADSPIVPGRDIEISFYYYAQSFLDFNQGTTHFYILVGVDTTENNTVDKIYDFEQNKFVSQTLTIPGTALPDQYYKRFDITNTNNWEIAKTRITNANFNVRTPKIEVNIFQAQFFNSAGTIQLPSVGKFYLDAFYISQKRNSQTLEHRKTAGNFLELLGGTDVNLSPISSEYKPKSVIHSCELDPQDINHVAGEFGRIGRTEFLTISLDRIRLQEIVNDYRSSGIRYNGTFFKDYSDEEPIFFYDKIWVNYGSTTLQEPVACIIDNLEYDVKQNVYNITMHLPNQDDPDSLAYDTFKYV